jgi:hypothetical protein
MHEKTPTLLVLLAPLLACSSDFAPYSKLDRLRVLGVQAEPPTPALGQACQLTALTSAPAGEVMAYHWRFCPVLAQAKDDYDCSFSEATAQRLFGTSPPFDLGSGETASFTNPFAPELLGALCAAGIEGSGVTQAVDCRPGFPVSIVLDVATSNDALRAAFTINLPAATPAESNANPAILGLSLGGQWLPEAPVQLSLPAGKSVELAAELSPDAVEMRPIPPSEAGTGLRRERLRLSWFADAGSVDQARTVYLDGESPLAQATLNHWTPPAAADWPAQGMVHLDVVVRDDRGGVGWISRQVQLAVQP